MLFNRTRFLRDVAYYRCTAWSSPRAAQKMQMDGDKAPPTPARVWVKKKQLAVLVPRVNKSGGAAGRWAQGRGRTRPGGSSPDDLGPHGRCALAVTGVEDPFRGPSPTCRRFTGGTPLPAHDRALQVASALSS